MTTAPGAFAAIVAVAVVGLAAMTAARSIARALRAPLRVTVVGLGLCYVTVLLIWVLRPAPIEAVHVLTDGANAHERAVAARRRFVFALGESTNLSARAVAAPDLASLRALLPELRRIVVHGRAPTGSETHGGADLAITGASRSPAAQDVSLTSLAWPSVVAPGESLTLHGTVEGNEASGVYAVLIDPTGARVATARVDTDGRFRLATRARAEGRFQYRIALTRTADSTEDAMFETRRLPLDVRAAEALNLLALWGAPSFEARFAEDWAHRGGATLATRTRIGETLVRTDGNWPTDQALTASVLERTDVALMDGRAWDELDATKRNEILQHVERGQLGIVLIPPLPSDLTSLGAPAPTGVDRELAVQLPGHSAALLPVEATWASGPPIPVLTTVDGQAAAIRVARGRGRVVVTGTRATHRLVTTGRPEQHAAYWQSLLDAALPDQDSRRFWITPDPPRARRRLVVCASGPDAESLVYRGQRVAPLALYPAPQGGACGLVWPEPGWFEMTLGEGPDALSRQWYASPRSAVTSPAPRAAPVLEHIAANAFADASGPRVPQAGLALLLLGLAAAAWASERAAWPGASPG